MLKALFKIKHDECTFTKAVEVTIETEYAKNSTKETVHAPPGFRFKCPYIEGGPGTCITRKETNWQDGGTFCKGSLPMIWQNWQTDHNAKDCPFINATCQYCKKKGHIKAVYSKKKGTPSQKSSQLALLINEKAIQTVNNIPGHNHVVQHMQLNGKHFQFEVDNSASHNFCSWQVWTKTAAWPNTLRISSLRSPAYPWHFSSQGLHGQLTTVRNNYTECLTTPKFDFARTNWNSFVGHWQSPAFAEFRECTMYQ